MIKMLANSSRLRTASLRLLGEFGARVFTLLIAYIASFQVLRGQTAQALEQRINELEQLREENVKRVAELKQTILDGQLLKECQQVTNHSKYLDTCLGMLLSRLAYPILLSPTLDLESRQTAWLSPLIANEANFLRLANETTEPDLFSIKVTNSSSGTAFKVGQRSSASSRTPVSIFSSPLTPGEASRIPEDLLHIVPTGFDRLRLSTNTSLTRLRQSLI